MAGTSPQLLLLGGISVASLVAGLYFLRYWLSTRDRFFLYLTSSFWIEGANRIYTGLTASWNEDSPIQYAIRVLSYLLILLAIWEKNRPRR
jgi:hypothetical protein